MIILNETLKIIKLVFIIFDVSHYAYYSTGVGFNKLMWFLRTSDPRI